MAGGEGSAATPANGAPGGAASPKKQGKKAKKTSQAELISKLRALHDAHNIPAANLEVVQKLGNSCLDDIELEWV
jgi:hypothetical protein